MMVDPMFMIVQSLMSFLTAVTPTGTTLTYFDLVDLL